MYIFDTSSLVNLFIWYSPKRFPTLWRLFNDLINNGNIISVRAVFLEIQERDDILTDWANSNKELFHNPVAEEAQFISTIYSAKNGHFQQNIQNKRRQSGKEVADPYLIASAKINKGSVVTNEKYKPHGAANIPAICEHFQISCLTLEGFMEQEAWVF